MAIIKTEDGEDCLRLVTGIEPIVIPPLPGIGTICKNYGKVFEFIGDAFVPLYVDESGEPTGETEILVFETLPGVNAPEGYYLERLSRDIRKLMLEQDQILWVSKRRKDVLGQRAAFFPFACRDSFYTAGVWRGKGGKLPHAYITETKEWRTQEAGITGESYHRFVVKASPENRARWLR